MVPWDVCIMPKDEEGLGLIDIQTHGFILEAKWVAICVEGCAPWKILLIHHILSAQHSGTIKGFFYLCDIVYFPHIFNVASNFIFKII